MDRAGDAASGDDACATGAAGVTTGAGRATDDVDDERRSAPTTATNVVGTRSPADSSGHPSRRPSTIILLFTSATPAAQRRYTVRADTNLANVRTLSPRPQTPPVINLCRYPGQGYTHQQCAQCLHDTLLAIDHARQTLQISELLRSLETVSSHTHGHHHHHHHHQGLGQALSGSSSVDPLPAPPVLAPQSAMFGALQLPTLSSFLSE